VFENRVLRRIFGPKRDEVMGEWNLGGTGWGGVEWIGLVQYRDLWRALVNAVVNLWVS
jgi:hypothetical protein